MQETLGRAEPQTEAVEQGSSAAEQATSAFEALGDKVLLTAIAIACVYIGVTSLVGWLRMRKLEQQGILSYAAITGILGACTLLGPVSLWAALSDAVGDAVLPEGLKLSFFDGWTLGFWALGLLTIYGLVRLQHLDSMHARELGSLLLGDDEEDDREDFDELFGR